MPSQRFELPVPHEIARVGALFDAPSGATRASALLFAHGAGIDMEHVWMSTLCAALVARGFSVLRFRYPYMERARREGKPMPPDRAPALEDAHNAALDELARRCPGRRRVLAGKSLGARMGSVIAAKGATAHGLVCFGYPLHPPQRPDKIRNEHFATLVQPALFLQGTRDEFATPAEIELALLRYSGRATLQLIDGGDHSFEMLKSARRSAAEVLDDVAARVEAWERETWPD